VTSTRASIAVRVVTIVDLSGCYEAALAGAAAATVDTSQNISGCSAR